jgi:hypothetical protein
LEIAQDPSPWGQQAQFQAIRAATSTTGSVSDTSTPHIQPLNGYPSEKPEEKDNWLLDLLLAGHEFKANHHEPPPE